MDQEKSFSVIILGDAGVGKSCILLRFSENKFNAKHNTTIGVEFGTGNLTIGATRVKLNIWDTAGTENFRSITRTFYRRAEGVLLVYDVTARHTFESLENWLSEIKQHCPAYAVVYLVGNQIDLVENKQEQRAVNEQEAREFVKKYGLSGFKETSATNGEGIQEAFQEFSIVLMNQLKDKKEAEVVNEKVVIKNEEKQMKKRCC